MPMRFRCCGNLATRGHADNCELKPTAEEVHKDPPTTHEEDEQGCQFDLFHFEHIGECKGTCDGVGDGIQQLTAGEDEDGVLIILLIEGDISTDDIKELGERGIKFLDRQELIDILSAYEDSEIEVQVQTMTVQEIKVQFEKKGEEPKEDVDPYLTVKEAAKELQFSEGWVRTLCRTERLEGAIKLMRRWAIPLDAIYDTED